MCVGLDVPRFGLRIEISLYGNGESASFSRSSPWIYSSEAVDSGDGSKHLHRLGLRSSASARRTGKGGSSGDAARDCGGQEEERSNRPRQDRGLPSWRATHENLAWGRSLHWALEIGDVSRFGSVKRAISYCGSCGDEKSSADKVLRTPLSKQRNKHIHRVMVEAAKLAPKQVTSSRCCTKRQSKKETRIEQRLLWREKWRSTCLQQIAASERSYG